MKQFFTLLKKEVKELLTLQMILPMVVVMIIFSMIGNVLTKEGEKLQQKQDVFVVDYDNTQTSKSLLELVEANGYTVILRDNVDSAKKLSTSYFFVIPKDFEKGIKKGEIQKLEVYNTIKSLSLMASMSSQSQSVAIAIIQNAVSDLIISNKVKDVSSEFIKTPIVPQEYILFRDISVQGNLTQVLGFMTSQTTFVPIILFIVTTLAAQLVATAIATEKENKTLETLLSSPVNRKAIVAAKLIAAAFVSLLMAGVYMVGMKSYMTGVMGGASSSTGVSDIITKLGLTIGSIDYVIIGFTLFLGIMVALSLAFILGSFAQDTKSAQTVITPIMVMLLIPYLLSMLLDISQLSTGIKALVYAIPFTHVFTVIPNILMYNYTNIIYGNIYLLVVVLISITVASKLFESDKVFTFQLNFGKKTGELAK